MTEAIITELLRQPRPGRFGETGIGVHIDLRLPGLPLARKVYQTPPGRDYVGGRAHRHDAEHDLVCLSGGCVIGLRPDPAGEVELIHLGPGEGYRVRVGMVHQLRVLPDSVVASYFPPLTWLRKETNLQILEEDWFRTPGATA